MVEVLPPSWGSSVLAREAKSAASGCPIQIRTGVLALLLSIVSGLGAGAAFGSAGDLDPDFAERGRTIVDSLPAARAVDIQSDGTIIAVGNRDSAGTLAVSRYLANGEPDVSLGGSGSLISVLGGDLAGSRLDVQSVTSLVDGKIGVLVNVAPFERPTMAAIRLLSTGEADPSFGGGDGVIELTEETQEASFDAEGRVLSVTDGVLQRVAANGEPDPEFSGDGSVALPAGQASPRLDVGTEGDILVATASPIQVARFQSNGDLEESYGNGGLSAPITVETSSVHTVAAAADGSVYLLIFAGDGLLPLDLLAHFTADGQPDPDFGRRGNGTVIVGGFPGDLAVDAMGRALTLSRAGGGAMVARRYSSNGSPDDSFGFLGEAEVFFGLGSSFAADFATSPDAGVVLAGGVLLPRGDEPVQALARLLPSGGPNDADADTVLDPKDACRFVASPRHRGCPTDRRKLTISKSRSTLEGRVRATTEKCAREESVYLFRQRPGRDRRGRRVDLHFTADGSVWKIGTGLARGHYYVATNARFVGRARCSKAVSRTVVVR